MSCIIGAIMYCTAAMNIPGPVGTDRPYLAHESWRYAAYYQPAILNWQPVVTPAAGLRRG